MNWIPVLICWCVCWIANRVHLLEGQTGVKTLLLHEAWLRSDEVQTSCGSDAMKCVRTRSRFRESTSTGTDLAGEDFQNTGTFIVVRSTPFAVSSEQSSPLARDAYNALWNSQRPGQVRNYSLVVRGKWLSEGSRTCQYFFWRISCGWFFRRRYDRTGIRTKKRPPKIMEAFCKHLDDGCFLSKFRSSSSQLFFQSVHDAGMHLTDARF